MAIDPDLIYAIGDVHGRRDLLDRMDDVINEDSAKHGGAPFIILLGDVVDRGGRSAQILDRLIARQASGEKIAILAGNHEDEMLRFLERPRPNARWLEFGGEQTLQSYGVATDSLRGRRIAQVIEAHVPGEHIDFLRGLPVALETPSFFFSHAGARPGVPLDRQSERDLMWFKDGMAADFASSGKLIVHGHDAQATARRHGKRINVDSGAYATGELSAVRLKKGEPPAFLIARDVGTTQQSSKRSSRGSGAV